MPANHNYNHFSSNETTQRQGKFSRCEANEFARSQTLLEALLETVPKSFLKRILASLGQRLFVAFLCSTKMISRVSTP